MQRLPRRKGPALGTVDPDHLGQQEGYLYLEIRDFQKGARKDDRMTPIAQSLSKEDALALAAYFAGKTWPKTGAPSASKADETSAMTAIKSVVCSSCHLEEFQGDSSIPRLAGQSPRLSRKNDDGFPDPRPREQSRHVGSHEHRHARSRVTAIAAYLAGL